MNWWFAVRAVELGPNPNPGSPSLKGPFSDYSAAEEARRKARNRYMQHTSLFTASDIVAATHQMQFESWTQI